jgi:hypothetical protein
MNGAAAAQRVDPRGSARRSPTAGNRGQGGKWLHPTTRRRIYERDHWRCVWCNINVTQLTGYLALVRNDSIRQATIDHVVPRARGGTNEHTNLITCCAQCNAVRGDKSAFSFAMHQACGSLELARSTLRRIRNARRRKLPPAPVSRIP